MTDALSAPTGRAPRVMSAAERERMRTAFRHLAEDEAALRAGRRPGEHREEVIVHDQPGGRFG